MKFSAVILAGGKGERFKSSGKPPEQTRELTITLLDKP